MIDAAFIVLIGFISFIAIAFRYGYKKSLAGLDQQISEIATTVEKAKQTLEKAKEKHSYEANYSAQIEHEIEDIYKRMHHQIDEIKNQATIDLDKAVQARIHYADSLMDRQRVEVVEYLKDHVTSTAVKALEELFKNHLPAKAHAEINSFSLEKLEKIFKNTHQEEAAQKKIVNGN